jgi:hypothetical protein
LKVRLQTVQCGAADCGKHREAAGAFAQGLIAVSSHTMTGAGEHGLIKI